jgi:hypothetical protein
VANVFYERMAATVRRLMAFLMMATALLILGVALALLLAILSFVYRTSDVSSAAEGDALVNV